MEKEPKVGDIIEMDNGELGIQQGKLIEDDDSISGISIEWGENDIEEFDYEIFKQFSGKIIKS